MEVDASSPEDAALCQYLGVDRFLIQDESRNSFTGTHKDLLMSEVVWSIERRGFFSWEEASREMGLFRPSAYAIYSSGNGARALKQALLHSTLADIQVFAIVNPHLPESILAELRRDVDQVFVETPSERISFDESVLGIESCMSRLWHYGSIAADLSSACARAQVPVEVIVPFGSGTLACSLQAHFDRNSVHSRRVTHPPQFVFTQERQNGFLANVARSTDPRTEGHILKLGRGENTLGSLLTSPFIHGSPTGVADKLWMPRQNSFAIRDRLDIFSRFSSFIELVDTPFLVQTWRVLKENGIRAEPSAATAFEALRQRAQRACFTGKLPVVVNTGEGLYVPPVV